MNLQLFIQRLSRRPSRRPAAPPGAAPSSTRTAGASSAVLPRPVQRLWARWAALAAAFVAAALVASCGGGGDGTGPASGGLGAPLSKAAVVGGQGSSVEMKVLVMSAEGTLPSFLAITSILDQIGVPYDKMVLKGPGATPFDASTLSDGAGNGKYQGIILETGDLAAFNAPTNNFPSALTDAQWKMLRQYQFDFGVRSATMFTRSANTIDVNGVSLDLTYGLTNVAEVKSTDASPVAVTVTPEGEQVFSYLNTATSILLKNAPGAELFTYPSTPVSNTTAVSLLQAADNINTLASIYTAPEGWQNLTLSADNNPELTHSLLLGYGIVNWVTKGVFLGSRKVYLSAQPDDVFLPDDLWDPATNTTPETIQFRHRNDATDYNSLVAWQTALNSNAQTASIKLEMPFNGFGYNTSDPNVLNQFEATDTLSPAVRANPNVFRWINHTWDHTSLDPEGGFTPTVASIVSQLQRNHEVATGQRSGDPDNGGPRVTFSNYNQNAMIQPDISGLENPVYWEAAQNFGLRYILMDTSKAYSNFIPARPVVAPIPPNTGFTSSLDTFVPTNPRIFIIPRYPTNLFFNVSTPAEWVSEYNFLFAALPPSQGGVGVVSDYNQILDRESEVLLGYMLKFHALSWMFHAANLRDYDGDGGTNRSLLSDLLDAVTTKYKARYNLPIENLSQTEIGQLMQDRMAYNAALAGGLKGRIVFGPTVTIELTNPSDAAVNVPMTGVSQGMTMAYGGQTISSVTLAAGGATSFEAPAAWIPPQADLSVTLTPSTPTPLSGGTLTYSVLLSNAGPSTVTLASFGSSLASGWGAITNVVSQASAGGSTASFSVGPTSVSGQVSLPAGGKLTVTYQVSVSPAATGTLASSANVTAPADITDPVPGNNTANAAVTVGFADVTSAVVLPANAPAGSVVTGTVTFSNASTVTGGTAVNATAVTGTVTLSSGDVHTFTVASLAPGASSTQTFTTTVPSALGTTALTASSTVATVTPESNTANNSAPAAGPLAVLFADPGVVVNPFPAGTPGSTVTTTLILSNVGGQTAVTFTPQVVVNGGAPQLLSQVSLAPGQTVTSVPINVLLTTTGGTVTANVTAATVPDSNLANNTDTKVSGALFADMTTAVVLPANAPAGSVVSGTVTFTNSGSAGTAASAVTGTVTLSNGQAQAFAVGDLVPGASSVQTFTTTVPSTVGTTVLNATSTVATVTPESNTGNNTGVSGSLAVLFADPGVVVNPIPSALEGVVVQTTLTLSNNGSTTVTFTPQVVVNGGAPVLLGAVTLAPGQSAASAPINVPMTATGATVTASVTAPSVPDRNPANDTSVAAVAVTPPAPPPPPTPDPAVDSGGGGCTINPDARFDPLLWMMLLVGGVAGTLRRRRTA
ncbi:MAG: hypothetical protein CVU30_13690 [Betaproteobacteria bacterium HGW-Betaproteobacteria-3]|nr:MAG: hypothetical protein CVU30_13690 [Betaproteobacteria bacterium HGW-Betaproteobacteria-3]